jgi:hypothetical protein
MAGQPENTNALSSGRRSARPGTVLARLGPRYSQCYRDVLRLRRGVESLLRRQHGGVTLLQGARVQSLCRLELNCRIAEQGVRDNPAMAPEQLRAERSLIAQWTCQRDNLLARLLGDGAGTADPWAALLAPATPGSGPAGQTDPEAVQGEENAAAATATHDGGEQ